MIKELGTSFAGLWTDPGEVHTGYVIVSVQDRTFEILNAGEVRGLEESADLLPFAVSSFGVRLWCYEGFRLYAHKADVKTWSEFPEVETIGAMKQAARPYQQSLYIHKQYASDIKIPPYVDAKLLAMGLSYKRVMPSNHTRDAFRHFLRYWNATLKYGYPTISGMKGSIQTWHH